MEWDLVHFGDKFALEVFGELGCLVEVGTYACPTWEEVGNAVANGVQIHLRRATPEESAWFAAHLALFKSTNQKLPI